MWAMTRARGTTGLIVAPTHKNLLGGALGVMLPYAYDLGIVRRYNKQDGELHLVDGKRIFIRSLDRPELVRGLSVTWLWGDELGMIGHREAWDILIACVRAQGLRQRLVTTTPPPEGKRHWLYDTFVLRGVAGIHEVVKTRTADNPFNPPDFEADLRREYADPYAARELDAEWIDVGAVQVYDVERLLVRQMPPPELRATARGWDTAATGGGGDYSAGALISQGEDGHIFIRDVVRGQWAPTERDARLRATAQGDLVQVPVYLAEERGGSGRSQGDYWTAQLAGFAVRRVLESGDKVVRAGPLAAQMGAGNVSLTCEPGRWENYWHQGKRLTPEAARAQFRRNLWMFPQGRTKDESDACALALEAVRGQDSGLGTRH
ncbi:MAG: hypothetical protein A2Y78_11250 [Acidobacteria bacterium RBG_13_68_16]|nr:MAG: hypothetical protein A2Y78_11250 [Acidobacteria bacterium RBG_13_68_16]